MANAPAVVYDAFSADATNKSNEEEEEEEEEEGDGGEVEDSAVLRYVMGCGPHNPIPSGRGGPSVISELRMRYPEPFKADQLKAVYSLEVGAPYNLTAHTYMPNGPIHACLVPSALLEPAAGGGQAGLRLALQNGRRWRGRAAIIQGAQHLGVHRYVRACCDGYGAEGAHVE